MSAMASGNNKTNTVSQNPNEMKSKETVSDLDIEQYIRATKPEAIAAANRYTPPLPKSLESMMVRSGTRSLVDDAEAFNRALDISRDNITLEDLEKITKKRTDLPPSTIMGTKFIDTFADKLEKKNKKTLDSGAAANVLSSEEQIDDEKAGIGTPPSVSGDALGKAAEKTLTLDEQLASMQEDLKKGREQDKWLAIAQAGLSIMASDKPTLGGAIGEGAGAGLQAYRDAQERYNEGVIDILNARAKLSKNKNAFSTKEILTRMSAVDSDLMKAQENLNEALYDRPADKEAHEAIRNQIRKLTELRDRLQILAGFEGTTTNKESRAKLIKESTGQ